MGLSSQGPCNAWISFQIQSWLTAFVKLWA